MASTKSRHTAVRLAAAVLAGLIVAFAVLTYLSYTAAFTSSDTVTVAAPRAGLVMELGAKVKYRGIQIGKVTDISPMPPIEARLTLAIDSGAMPYIPSNATVHDRGQHHLRREVGGIRCTPDPVGRCRCDPNAHALRRQRCNWKSIPCFSSLMDLLHKIDPVELNGTLSALVRRPAAVVDDRRWALCSLD